MRALVLYRYRVLEQTVLVRLRTVPGRALTGLAAGWVTDGVARCPAIGPANPYVLERHALDRHICPCLACHAATLVTVWVARCPSVGPANPYATCPVAGAPVLGRKRVPGKVVLLPQLQAMLSAFPCPGPVQACLAGTLAWQLPFLWGRHWGSHRAARASVWSSMWSRPGAGAQFALPGGPGTRRQSLRV